MDLQEVTRVDRPSGWRFIKNYWSYLLRSGIRTLLAVAVVALVVFVWLCYFGVFDYTQLGLPNYSETHLPPTYIGPSDYNRNNPIALWQVIVFSLAIVPVLILTWGDFRLMRRFWQGHRLLRQTVPVRMSLSVEVYHRERDLWAGGTIHIIDAHLYRLNDSHDWEIWQSPRILKPRGWEPQNGLREIVNVYTGNPDDDSQPIVIHSTHGFLIDDTRNASVFDSDQNVHY